MRRHQTSGWEPQHRASVRHRVAIEAARILYHREVKEYWHAKREAAKRQGTPHLPSNREVHEQLLLIARKVEGDEHQRRLTAMRVQALALMERLEEFHPRLIGSVLTGHIRSGSDIDLNVHCDDVEPVVALLEDHQPVVEIVRSRKDGENQEFIHVRLANVGGFEAEITVYPMEWLSVHPRCGITGGPMRRASLPELRKLLEVEPVPETPALGQLLDLEVAHRLLPELLACRGVLQNNYHHLDVYDHTLATVRGLAEMVQSGYARFGRWAERLQALDPELLYLAGYCHDLGKPATQSYARDGRIRFIGHEHLGADMCRTITQRLGLPAEPLVGIVAVHLEAVMIPAEDGGGGRIRRLFARTGAHLPVLALLSLADVEAALGPAQSAHRLDEHARFVDFLLEQFYEGGFLANPCLPVSREDLVEEFGLTHPKAQNRLLESLMDAFVEGEFEGREEGLLLASELLSAP